MAAMHGMVRMVMVMLVVMKASLGAEGLWVTGGGAGVRSAGREEDKRTVAHVRPFGAGDVGAAVAAGVSQVAARTLGKTWELSRGGGGG